MIPAPFKYIRVASVEEALGALAEPEAHPLAGGQSLLPLMKLRLAQPALLVDIARIAIRGIEERCGNLKIGALTTWDDLASAALPPSVAALRESAAEVGDQQIRNLGTLGGGLAHADPASNAPAALLALCSRFVLRNATEEREIEGDKFFLGPFSTVLGPSELLTHVIVPEPTAGSGSAYRSLKDPASGYPLAAAAASVTLCEGRVSACSIGVSGVSSAPFRATQTEEVILAGGGTRALDEGIRAALDGVEVRAETADLAYKKHVAGVVLRRAVEAAAARAQDSNQGSWP